MPLHHKLPKPLLIIIAITIAAGGGSILYLISNQVLYQFNYYQNLQTRKDLRKQNIELKKKILKMKITQSQKSSLLEKNKRLKRMLALKEDYPLKLIAANIIQTTPWKWNRKVLINKGEKSGISVNSLVIDSKNNLIGKIEKTNKSYALVKLITDPDFKVVVSCNKIKTILKGSLFKGAKLLYIPYDAQIKKNDLVSISNLDGKRVNIKIGKINMVSTSANQLTKIIFVKPFSKPAELTKVFVIEKE